MARDPQFVLDYLVQTEELAEDVLADKQHIVDLDKMRNSNREALSALHKKVVAPVSNPNKTWLNLGGIFIKISKEASIDMLQSDQKVLDEEVQSLRKGLHKKVNRLLDAQGKATTQGFDLTPLDVDELKKLKY